MLPICLASCSNSSTLDQPTLTQSPAKSPRLAVVQSCPQSFPVAAPRRLMLDCLAGDYSVAIVGRWSHWGATTTTAVAEEFAGTGKNRSVLFDRVTLLLRGLTSSSGDRRYTFLVETTPGTPAGTPRNTVEWQMVPYLSPTPSQPDFARARQAWLEGIPAIGTAGQGGQWERAANYLKAGLTADKDTTGYSAAIADLEYLVHQPDMMGSAQEAAQFAQYMTNVNEFFGLPSQYVTF